ncbi:alpha/beta hydrolase family protein [Micromonospora sp. Llam0]|uniref:alpha/beta fold hydrolase n=1 Tax=Micromonospora sp. Llam0 TaxID=2485143 RepID=UPI000F4632C8|nr:alpha/beta hydrolase [Micromonospora sp. Llam0]ROO60162.1 alpha/beta hydrolase family protein [Micromonospora sp. Llam0]
MRFVLVHGSWHDGNCWDGVRQALTAAGHEVHAPTLPGNGANADPTVSFTRTAEAVAGLIRRADLRDVVLVGHSLGGAVVQAVAVAVPDRLRRLVFHNAYVLADGDTVFQHVPPSAAAAFTSLASPEGTLMLPYEAFRSFISDADEQTARAAYARLTPEPLARAAEPVALPGFADLPVPRSYLYAVDDVAFPPDEFRWHPGQSQRLGEFRLVEMPGSHEVLFTDPQLLAAKLVEAAAD